MPIAAGTRLGPYEIVGLLGAGGMGEVYRAEDKRLGRPVAVKVLPPNVCGDPGRLRRFEQEAKAESVLNHPNVVIVHDIGTQDGTPYIVTELLEGESLRERLKRGPLPLRDAVGVALQIARGLTAAHVKGIVHRDLKPDNVFLTPGGGVKILDFGVAKLLESYWPSGPLDSQQLAELGESETRSYVAATGFGAIVGTPAYMSPEQARGGHVDFRSDLFSFGIVLYEMLTGKDPFLRGSAADTLSAILRDKPPLPQASGRRHTPAELKRVVQRTLAKDPAQRYRASEQVVEDLERLARRLEQRILTPRRAVVAAVLLLAGVTAAWVARRPPAPPAGPRPAVSLLVADFENRTGDPVFDGALEQALQIGLEGAPFVAAFERGQARRQAATLSTDKSTSLDRARARLVATSLGISLVVAGTLEPRGTGFALTSEIDEAVSGSPLGTARADAAGKAEVLKAVDAIVARLRRTLGDVTPRSAAVLEGETFTTASLAAMGAYARGQELHHQGRSDEAVAEYGRAVEHDPDFGRAYCGLAAEYYNRGEYEKSEQQFRLALAHLDRMSDRERHRTRGLYCILVRDYAKAVEEYERLLREYPSDSAGRANLAFAHFLARRMDRALDEGRRAVELFPKLITARSNLALYALYAGDFDTAEREARAVIERNASYAKGYVAIALSQLARGRPEDARATYQRLESLGGRAASSAVMGEADLALYQGRLSEAALLLENGVAKDEAGGLAAAEATKRVTLARVELARGRKARAVATARRALERSRRASVVFPAALVLLEAGRATEASALAVELGSRWEADSRAYALLIAGESDLARAEPRQALEHFLAAKEVDDTWIGRLALARAYLAASALPEAHSELEVCLERRGEALAVFLDDVPSARYLPSVHYYLGRVQEGLGNPGAADSYRSFLTTRPRADPADALAADARRRLAAH